MAQALARLQGDDKVGVIEGVDHLPTAGHLPARQASSSILAAAPTRAPTPQAKAIAERGYPVVIVPMPLNLAVLYAGRTK